MSDGREPILFSWDPYLKTTGLINELQMWILEIY